jgi:hypothetical protein
LIGVYETHTHDVVTFIDARDPTCRELGHRQGARLATGSAQIQTSARELYGTTSPDFTSV